MGLLKGNFNTKLFLTIRLIALIVVLGRFSTSLPALFLYGVLIVVSLLIPYKHVNNRMLLWIIGCSSIGVGVWFYLWEMDSFIVLLLYTMAGIVAIILPYILPQKFVE